MSWSCSALQSVSPRTAEKHYQAIFKLLKCYQTASDAHIIFPTCPKWPHQIIDYVRIDMNLLWHIASSMRQARQWIQGDNRLPVSLRVRNHGKLRIANKPTPYLGAHQPTSRQVISMQLKNDFNAVISDKFRTVQEAGEVWPATRRTVCIHYWNGCAYNC